MAFCIWSRGHLARDKAVEPNTECPKTLKLEASMPKIHHYFPILNLNLAQDLPRLKVVLLCLAQIFYGCFFFVL